MTTISELAAGIIADARLQAGRIDEEARKEVERIRDETATLAQAQRARIEQHAAQELRVAQARAEARRQLAARQATLACKQELIDETFAAAAKAIDRLTPAQRRAIVNRLLDRAKRQLAIGSVKAAKQDMRTIKGIRATPLQCSGGFIAVSKDGTQRIDMRFSTLLEHMRTHRTGEIAGMLFGETKETAKVTRQPIKKLAVKKQRTPKRRRIKTHATKAPHKAKDTAPKRRR